ncbi:1-acyl-sn-glycerol-3-phosphate acyltransferase [Corynebacterium guangdongense]|uniref:1-acyl-sn-glycerol-3-phosphate acyltransferase n=1 Tax=Corynebacterium guangdongense TaxID=1783348 RepID=A0ABU1ZZU7_9CORY|nr:1-acyl-sn-glycerol-3-phosphate acyltransferase [Corynebacterium guangdongense]
MRYRIAGGQFRVPADLPEVDNHPVESGERFYNGFVIRVLKAVLRAQGIAVTVVGAEHLPATGGALLAMNHTGYYDFIFGEIPGHVRGRRLVRFMAKKEVFDTPVVGAIMKSMDHASVDRDKGASSVEEAIRRLRDGQIVGIFPEATISRSFELKEFKTGAARIAAGAGVPLIPMVTWGSQRIWTKGRKKHLGRSNVPVFIHVGAPVDTSGTPEEATARLKSVMSELLADARAAYDAEYGPFEDGLY